MSTAELDKLQFGIINFSYWPNGEKISYARTDTLAELLHLVKLLKRYRELGGFRNASDGKHGSELDNIAHDILVVLD